MTTTRKTSTILCALAVCLLALAVPARAEIGTIDAVPAATLLLPYFEVDLTNPNGITTLFSVNNASASAAVAHVTATRARCHRTSTSRARPARAPTRIRQPARSTPS